MDTIRPLVEQPLSILKAKGLIQVNHIKQILKGMTLESNKQTVNSKCQVFWALTVSSLQTRTYISANSVDLDQKARNKPSL